MQQREQARQQRRDLMGEAGNDTDDGFWLIDLLPRLAVIVGAYLLFRALVRDETGATEEPPREAEAKE